MPQRDRFCGAVIHGASGGAFPLLSPAFPLRIGNPLSGCRAKLPVFAGWRCGAIFGSSRGGEQGTNLCEACNFVIDGSEDPAGSHGPEYVEGDPLHVVAEKEALLEAA